jgi:hypothetical protein
MRAVLAGIAGLASAAALALAPTPASAAPYTCPADPPPGSTVNGGLDVVTGVCHLVGVTVNGGIMVDSNAHLELEKATVNGGITVEPNGELESGHTIHSVVATFTPSVIRGDINWIQGSDLDLDNATVLGAVNIEGPVLPTSGSPTICGSTFMGALRITDLNGAQLFEPPEFGDPGEPIEFGPYPDCPSNTFGGSVEFRNSSVIEMEGNQIGGSVQLDGSQIDV